MTAFPHDLIAETEPSDESELPGQIAVDGDTAARLDALARLVELPPAAVLLTLAHATFDDFLRLHARRSVTDVRGRQCHGGGQ